MDKVDERLDQRIVDLSKAMVSKAQQIQARR
jgi:hypothetical protein